MADNEINSDGNVEPALDDPSTKTVGDQSASVGSPEGQTSPVWNAEEYALNVNGNKILPKNKDNIITWASQGYNYSQKMNELKGKTQELTEREKKIAQYEQLNDAFEKNPNFRKQIIDLYDKAQSGTATQQQEDKVSALPPEILDKLSAIDTIQTDFQKIKEEKEDQLLEHEINTLKKQYPKEDWETDDGSGTLLVKVLRKANETGLTDLHDVYKILRFDSIQTNTEAETRKKLADEATENARRGIVSSASPQRSTNPEIDINQPWAKLNASEMLESVKQT